MHNILFSYCLFDVCIKVHFDSFICFLLITKWSYMMRITCSWMHDIWFFNKRTDPSDGMLFASHLFRYIIFQHHMSRYPMYNLVLSHHRHKSDCDPPTTKRSWSPKLFSLFT
eukprot:612843_1